MNQVAFSVMNISPKIIAITIAFFVVSFATVANAAEMSGVDLSNASQGNIELQQWDPSPEDSGQCNGKKCATGGSY